MKVAQLPIDWLVHSVSYVVIGEENRWGESTEEIIDVSNVRVEPTKSFSVNQQQEQVTANLVIFIDGVHSSPIPNFKVGNKIIWQGNEHVIVRVLPFNLPDSPKLHHIEVEVV